jgi:protein-tyrosine phosphatase
VEAVLSGLAAADMSCVYLHCRAGHGRTGMVAAVLLGVVYPTMGIKRVMQYVQQVPSTDHCHSECTGPRYDQISPDS